MSTVLESKPDSLVIPPFPVRRWTVAEYRHLAEIGVLTEDDNVELLEGWIVPKMTKKPPHEWAVTQLSRKLTPHLGQDWLVRVQCAINTADSEPEPDVAIVREPNDRYLKRHPQGPDDIGLVVEVADTTVLKDRRKAAIYAADLIPQYWLVNLVDRQIEAHSDPDGRQREYRTTDVLRPGDAIDFILDDRVLFHIPTDQILPPED